jgi:putative glutamine amidotransferase
MRKPILGICYGLQILNVYRSGSLIQHIPDFLPEETRTRVNHEAGRTVAMAHAAEIEGNSKLAEIVRGKNDAASRSESGKIVVPVNSSHHQSANSIGDGLRIVARCPDDGIVEAVEGTASDHFVLAVQWHPERSVDEDEPSRAIFKALVEAARVRRRQLARDFESVK